MARAGLSFAEMNSMSASREFLSPHNITVVVTVDIDDCPMAIIPLTELFDFTTLTVVEDYLRVLGGYVKQQLESTTWLDKQSSSDLLSARFATYEVRDTGELVSIRKPAIQRMIVRNLQCYNDNQSWSTIPILIAFMVSASKLPRRPGTKPGHGDVPYMRGSVMQPTSRHSVGNMLTVPSSTHDAVNGLAISKTLIIVKCLSTSMDHDGTRSQEGYSLDINDCYLDQAMATFADTAPEATAKETDIRFVDSNSEVVIGRVQDYILDRTKVLHELGNGVTLATALAKHIFVDGSISDVLTTNKHEKLLLVDISGHVHSNIVDVWRAGVAIILGPPPDGLTTGRPMTAFPSCHLNPITVVTTNSNKLRLRQPAMSNVLGTNASMKLDRGTFENANTIHASTETHNMWMSFHGRDLNINLSVTLQRNEEHTLNDYDFAISGTERADTGNGETGNVTLEDVLLIMPEDSNGNAVTTTDGMGDSVLSLLSVEEDIFKETYLLHTLLCVQDCGGDPNAILVTIRGGSKSFASNGSANEKRHTIDCRHRLPSFDLPNIAADKNPNRFCLSMLMQHKPVDRGRVLRVYHDFTPLIVVMILLWRPLAPASPC
jgi:hypothetical protein